MKFNRSFSIYQKAKETTTPAHSALSETEVPDLERPSDLQVSAILRFPQQFNYEITDCQRKGVNASLGFRDKGLYRRPTIIVDSHHSQKGCAPKQ